MISADTSPLHHNDPDQHALVSGLRPKVRPYTALECPEIIPETGILSDYYNHIVCLRYSLDAFCELLRCKGDSIRPVDLLIESVAGLPTYTEYTRSWVEKHLELSPSLAFSDFVDDSNRDQIATLDKLAEQTRALLGASGGFDFEALVANLIEAERLIYGRSEATCILEDLISPTDMARAQRILTDAMVRQRTGGAI
jgi:hypothetical protein